jgi:hypothetical protein
VTSSPELSRRCFHFGHRLPCGPISTWAAPRLGAPRLWPPGTIFFQCILTRTSSPGQCWGESICRAPAGVPHPGGIDRRR